VRGHRRPCVRCRTSGLAYVMGLGES
jgi:hypothetical protein